MPDGLSSPAAGTASYLEIEIDTGGCLVAILAFPHIFVPVESQKLQKPLGVGAMHGAKREKMANRVIRDRAWCVELSKEWRYGKGLMLKGLQLSKTKFCGSANAC